ncbi:MAG TPA: hypothetical protein VK605_06305 [Solirubrobacteraceae bacterium]|nr:hypothetical protein [Solirubrobacteraceae bacterium]
MGQPAAAPFVSMVCMPATEIFDTLIAETRDLDSAAGSVQGDQELVATAKDVEALIAAYQEWYARALGVLPQEFHEKFIDLFEGGLVIKRVKSFLEGPGRVSSMFNPEAAALFPYWEHPFETTFHSSLLEQRQILTLAKQVVQQDASLADLDLVERLGRGLPGLIDALTHRHADRDPLVVSDEYDVQDLLTGVLRMIFEDVRVEDPSPAQAGGSSRLDFVLKRQRIIVEVKMTRQGLRDRDVGKQLIEDIERYRGHPDGDALVAIVYDPERHVRNPQGLENDLKRDHGGLVVRVVVTG